MHPGIEGSRAKVQRAKEHFRDLLAKRQDFLNLNPYGVVIENDPNTGERIWRTRVSRDIPSDWGLIVGDVVHSLRAALDYLAWQLVTLNDERELNDGIAFRVNDPTKKPPTKPSAIRERAAKRQNEIRAFGPAAVAIIDRLQPDAGGNATPNPELHPLGMLHKLDIWDKHKRLNIVGGVLRLSGLRSPPGEDFHIERMVVGGGDVRRVPIADGTELLRLTLGAKTPNVQMEPQFVHFVAFEQEGPGKGEEVFERLNKLIGFVDQAITLFAPLFDPPVHDRASGRSNPHPPPMAPPFKPPADPANPTERELRAMGLDPDFEIRPPGAPPRFPKQGSPK